MSRGEGNLGARGGDVPATPTRRSARLASKRQLGGTPSTPTTAPRPRPRTPATRIRATPAKSQSERRPISRTQQTTTRKDLSDESPTVRPRARSKLDPRETSLTSRARATPKKEATKKATGVVKRTPRSTRSSTRTPTEEVEDEDTKSRPPVHPDLEAAAKTLASLSESRSSRTSSNASLSRQLVFADALNNMQQEDEDSDISDLSDVGDPRFASLMTAEAESATMSAAGSAAGSVCGESDSEAPAAMPEKPAAETPAASVSTPRGLHTRFDDNIEAVSGGKEEELEDTKRVVEASAAAIENDSDSDSDSDEAPEMVTSKGQIADTAVADANAKKDEASKPNDAAAEPSTKASKRRRARHRKRAATAEATKAMSAVLANAAEQQKHGLGGLNPVQLPSEIPAELRLDTLGRAPRTDSSSAKPSKGDLAENHLDASVLAEFGAETAKRKRSNDNTSAVARPKKKSKKNKEIKDKSSRVVSGIRVVAAQKPSKTSLLDMLAQSSIPKKARNFTREKRGGSRIRRSVPLNAIAKRNNQPAINFLK
ncbi:hypothetical protein H4R20_000298 [Coemansia guatemalensis]|uniref:Uncharacterized protein n=1 Tax=Coemansia guatemalensis TaxID=2761395 RepID=A0A9W8HZ61_9FUNG|nr:hypothetical protein H4R20_000298 [Coemansia guatemalensis]